MISNPGMRAQELDEPAYGHFFVKKLVARALDKHNHEREMASLLLSALAGEARIHSACRPLHLRPWLMCQNTLAAERGPGSSCFSLASATDCQQRLNGAAAEASQRIQGRGGSALAKVPSSKRTALQTCRW